MIILLFFFLPIGSPGHRRVPLPMTGWTLARIGWLFMFILGPSLLHDSGGLWTVGGHLLMFNFCFVDKLQGSDGSRWGAESDIEYSTELMGQERNCSVRCTLCLSAICGVDYSPQFLFLIAFGKYILSNAHRSARFNLGFIPSFQTNQQWNRGCVTNIKEWLVFRLLAGRNVIWIKVCCLQDAATEHTRSMAR